MLGKKGSNQFIKAASEGKIWCITEETRKKISISSKNRPPKTPEARARLSLLAKERRLGGIRQSKRIYYNGVYLGSSYELKLAQDLDKHNVAWEQPERFLYTDNSGKQRTYTPDFFLPKFNVFLDPKNDFLINNINPSLGFCDRDKIKRVEEQNGIKILILNKDELNYATLAERLKAAFL